MEMLAVSGGSERLCVDVTISDDNIVEYNETLHIVLTTNDETISLDFATAEVFIVNDDSESNCVPHDYNSSQSFTQMWWLKLMRRWQLKQVELSLSVWCLTVELSVLWTLSSLHLKMGVLQVCMDE